MSARADRRHSINRYLFSVANRVTWCCKRAISAACSATIGGYQIYPIAFSADFVNAAGVKLSVILDVVNTDLLSFFYINAAIFNFADHSCSTGGSSN